MKRLIAICLILSLLAALTVPVLAAEDVCFEDVVSGDWYYDAVRQAYERGFMDGISDSRFEPDGAMTRGEFVSSLGLVAGVRRDSYSGDSGFADVPSNYDCAPYAAWALETGITQGVSEGRFDPAGALDQTQMMVMISRLLQNMDFELPVPAEGAAEFSMLMRDSVPVETRLGLLIQYGVLPDSIEIGGEALATRAMVASLMVWVNDLIWEGNTPVVNPWQEYVPLTVEAVPQVENPVVSPESIVSWAEYYGFAVNSTAFQALCAINTKYAGQLTEADRLSPLLFLFEGAGATANPAIRMDAMCVVVKDGEIAYLNLNSSTIPDDPFDPKKNDGVAIPTLVSGIYTYASANQNSYAALNVKGAQVIRFENQSSYYPSSSIHINIHRRSRDVPAPADANWGNSVGCSLIGAAGTDPSGEYAKFIVCMGIVPAGSAGNIPYAYDVTGKVVVDRSFGRDYLRSVGYPEEALDLIG